MTIQISAEEARRFLIRYHFERTDSGGVLDRIRTVQYDPLNPLGRNPDLVLQARIPHYRIDDWQRTAYQDRLLYDGWDKQACLIPVEQWAMRWPIRSSYLAWHDRSVLDEHPDVVAAALAELDARGPQSSLEFEDRRRTASAHSWYGPTVIKRVLRALWLRGIVATHHRQAGRHYYDRAERVIPSQFFNAPQPSMDEYHRQIVLHRHRAVGLLRQAAEAAIWSACGPASTRLAAIQELNAAGELLKVRVENGTSTFHIPASEVGLLSSPALDPVVRFLAPLDNMLWDRAAVRSLFNFDYVWEVYKKPHDRRWGYYVLPVLYGDTFAARFDARLEGQTWVIDRWWWEPETRIGPDILAALQSAAAHFAAYLGARMVRVPRSLDAPTRDALRQGVKVART